MADRQPAAEATHYQSVGFSLPTRFLETSDDPRWRAERLQRR